MLVLADYTTMRAAAAGPQHMSAFEQLHLRWRRHRDQQPDTSAPFGMASGTTSDAVAPASTITSWLTEVTSFATATACGPGSRERSTVMWRRRAASHHCHVRTYGFVLNMQLAGGLAGLGQLHGRSDLAPGRDGDGNRGRRRTGARSSSV